MRNASWILGGLAALGLMVLPSQAEDKSGAAYTVVVKSTQVKTTTKDGGHWDINEGKPDLAVSVRNMSVQDSEAFETKEMADTFTAQFNAPSTIKVRPGQKLEIEVIDKDAAVHDTIGKFQKELTEGDLQNGTMKLENFGQVLILELEFKKL